MTTPLAPIPPPAPKPKKPPVPSWVVLVAMLVTVLIGLGLVLRTPEQTTSILATLIPSIIMLANYWQSVRNAESLVAQHQQMNSVKDELVAHAQDAAYLKGLAAGKALRDPPSAP